MPISSALSVEVKGYRERWTPIDLTAPDIYVERGDPLIKQYPAIKGVNLAGTVYGVRWQPADDFDDGWGRWLPDRFEMDSATI